MVWSQYVYEATAGLEVDTAVGSSDDDTSDHDVGLNICDWELNIQKNFGIFGEC